MKIVDHQSTNAILVAEKKDYKESVRRSILSGSCAFIESCREMETPVRQKDMSPLSFEMVVSL
jgi:hypothetical protein